MKLISGGVCAAKGFQAAGIHCGIRHNRSKKDLALIVSEKPASAAAVYTTNLVKGAPLAVTKAHLANGRAQAVVCNSGNANTCNADGPAIAEGMAELAAQALGLKDRGLHRRHRPEPEPGAHPGGHRPPGRRPEHRRQRRRLRGHHDHRHPAQGGGRGV